MCVKALNFCRTMIVKRKRSQSKTAETKYFLPSFACILNKPIVIPKCFFVTPKMGYLEYSNF